MEVENLIAQKTRVLRRLNLNLNLPHQVPVQDLALMMTTIRKTSSHLVINVWTCSMATVAMSAAHVTGPGQPQMQKGATLKMLPAAATNKKKQKIICSLIVAKASA